MRKWSLSFLVLFSALTSRGQQYNTWYFGQGAGLSFNPGGSTLPYVLTDNFNSADEGNASISDQNGSILFYTNGKTVYNRLHQPMLNGNNLAGNTSAVQSSLIVPMPNNDSIYYLFTADAIENHFLNGYRYSIINMHRDGGNGAVVNKNISLDQSSTERLTAARHANGIDVWIIGNENNSNVFKSWLLTCTGLQSAPVVSTTGVVMTDLNIGMMKVSPDGTQLCQTNYQDVPENFFQLLDFDNASGLVSNPRSISNPGIAYYSCEFSPDSKLLYVTRVTNPFIDQFEATLGTAAAINSSRISVPADFGFYGIQTGPDQAIYLNNHSTTISVISSPNGKGTACNFQSRKINLGSINGALGLPSAINDGPSDPHNNFSWSVLDSCGGKVQFFGQTNMGGSLSWSWDFGDGTTSPLQNPVHSFSPPAQLYPVQLIVKSATACGYVEKTKDVLPAGLGVQPGFTFVSKCDSGYVRFINTSTIFPANAPVSYEWNFGDGTASTDNDPVHSYPGSGSFTVTLKIKTNKTCIDRSVSQDINLETLNIQVTPSQTIDAGQSVQLSVTGGGNHFLWTPGRWLSDSTIASPLARPQDNVTYSVKVTNDAGCVAVDSVSIHLNPIDGIFVPTAFTPGNDGLNDIMRPLLSRQYQLQEFTIYNRWGERLYATSQSGSGWDGRLAGKPQPDGVYVWTVLVKDAGGKLISRQGTVTLIR